MPAWDDDAERCPGSLRPPRRGLPRPRTRTLPAAVLRGPDEEALATTALYSIAPSEQV